MSKKKTAAKAVAQLALEGRKILVVDDEDDARTFLSTVLGDSGAAIIEASDGDQAIGLAKSAKPDLITLDISMPGKDGVEVFRQLRGGPETQAIPICVITGHPEFREVIYAVPTAKPEGYMHKPVNAEDLVNGLRRIFELADKKQ